MAWNIEFFPNTLIVKKLSIQNMELNDLRKIICLRKSEVFV